MPPSPSLPPASAAADWLRARLDGRPVPRLALITGSGLGAIADKVEDRWQVATSELPHWPTSTVEGHAGHLVLGTLAGQPILVMQGRVHFYEGYPMAQVTFPIRVLQALGTHTLIVTNAAGGLEPSWDAGDIMLIRDHINLPGMAGQNPLIGPNEAALGPRFPNMANAYSPALRQVARTVAEEAGITLREGTYAMVSGPSYETPAELRLLHALGAHAVGMSTAPEVVVARHAGIEVLGFSLLTNKALLDPTPEEETTHEEVLTVGAQAAPRLIQLIEQTVARLPTS